MSVENAEGFAVKDCEGRANDAERMAEAGGPRCNVACHLELCCVHCGSARACVFSARTGEKTVSRRGEAPRGERGMQHPQPTVEEEADWRSHQCPVPREGPNSLLR